MALTLNDPANAKKAATGPNPQNRAAQTSRNATGYSPLATAINQGVSAAGAQAGAQPRLAQPQAPLGQKPVYDYTTDPALQNILGTQQLAIQQAQADADAQTTQAVIAHGDAALALALTGDKNTAAAAGANPTSTLATLAAQNAANVRSTNETENKQNLTYSSDRGYQLGLAQQSYLANQSSAAGNLQSTLGGISSNLLSAEQTAYGNEASAQMAAYDRALKHPVGVTQPTAHASGVPAALRQGAQTGSGLAQLASAHAPTASPLSYLVKARAA